MKILFIENRYRTKLWELIASGLKYEHEIFWIVQNHMFCPSFGEIKKLSYPEGQYKNKLYDNDIAKIISSNRGINYFGIRNDDFIFHYRDQINQCIGEINPDIVFGESTLFHELLVINACKRKNILYLHPSSTRYPKNRFSFYLYDSLIPYGGSEENISNKTAENLIYTIINRDIQPDYMSYSKTRLNFLEKIKNKLLLTSSFLFGEKFNTPSPIKKIILDKEAYYLRRKWDKLSRDFKNQNNKFYILFPLQLQPEANIDVWGYPHNNQLEVIKSIFKDLKKDEILVIKPNPKSKYEISSELLDFVELNKDKVLPLNHSVNMNDIWGKIDLVVTVTGTVAIECILANKPIIMFGKALHSNMSNLFQYGGLNGSIRDVVEKVKNYKYPTLTKLDKIKYIKTLFTTSFEGINGDGLNNKNYLEDQENLEKLLISYKKIINQAEKN